MKRHLVKEEKKYVIATIYEPTLFLRSLRMGNYEFVNDISIATKTRGFSLACEIINNYRYDTGDNAELVAVPLIVSYDLVENE